MFCSSAHTFTLTSRNSKRFTPHLSHPVRAELMQERHSTPVSPPRKTSWSRLLTALMSHYQGFPTSGWIAKSRVCVWCGSRWRLSGRSWWSWAMAPVGRPASSLCSAKTSSLRCTFPPCLRTTWPTSRWTADRWAGGCRATCLDTSDRMCHFSPLAVSHAFL